MQYQIGAGLVEFPIVAETDQFNRRREWSGHIQDCIAAPNRSEPLVTSAK